MCFVHLFLLLYILQNRETGNNTIQHNNCERQIHKRNGALSYRIIKGNKLRGYQLKGKYKSA